MVGKTQIKIIQIIFEKESVSTKLLSLYLSYVQLCVRYHDVHSTYLYLSHRRFFFSAEGQQNKNKNSG